MRYAVTVRDLSSVAACSTVFVWSFGLLERRSRGRGTLEYRISDAGRARLRWLRSQNGQTGSMTLIAESESRLDVPCLELKRHAEACRKTAWRSHCRSRKQACKVDDVQPIRQISRLKLHLNRPQLFSVKLCSCAQVE